MKLVVAFALCAAAASAAPSLTDVEARLLFSKWMKEHGKYYETGEEQAYRLDMFKQNMALIRDHNERQARGESSFTLGATRFADMSNEEYRRTALGLRTGRSLRPAGKAFDASSVKDVPTTWDWRQKGAVNAVKDQGQCGSCWAFSATAALEGEWFIQKGQLLSLSEQMCVDCVNGGADTCDVGGEMHDCYLQVIQQGGDMTEADYPYEATSGNKCGFDKTKAVTSFSAYVNVTMGDENALQTAASGHVISVGIDASSFSFQLYSGGVYDESSCKNKYDELDHGVAVVGYGSLSGKDYWTVRNSWGAGWGMQGYILMSRNKNNQCGIATDATYPIL